MPDRPSLQAVPEPMARRQPDAEAETRPGWLGDLAALIGLPVAVAAVALVALGWLSMAVSVLTPIGLAPDRITNPLDSDVRFIESTVPTGTMPPDFIGEDARGANRTLAIYPGQPATPFPAVGQPARDEH